MTTVISRHRLTLCPDHHIVVLRDIDADADPGAGAAISETHQHIAASSGYGIYVETVQNLIDVRVDVEVCDGEPDDDPVDSGWQGPLRLPLDSETGQLLFGDDMGNAIDGIDPPRGRGRYRVAFYHRGRDFIAEVVRDLLPLMAGPDGDRQLEIMQARHRGAERYLLRLWFSDDLPDEDPDDLE